MDNKQVEQNNKALLTGTIVYAIWQFRNKNTDVLDSSTLYILY